MIGRLASRRSAWLPLAAAALIAIAIAAPAEGERAQRGDLIVDLQGHISPLQLSRRESQPVSLHLAGGLQTVDGALLPRVRRIEIGLPAKGTISTRGLPVCAARRLRNATSAGALAACAPALVGSGKVEADVLLPGQRPFRIHARLLVFNGPRASGGGRLLLLHGFARRPPTTVVLPFRLGRRPGRFGTSIAADLPPALGPWPHLARFEIALGRRYEYRGRQRSFLGATCPIPPRFTAGFFSLAKVTYTLPADRRIGIAITRGCRAKP